MPAIPIHRQIAMAFTCYRKYSGRMGFIQPTDKKRGRVIVVLPESVLGGKVQRTAPILIHIVRPSFVAIVVAVTPQDAFGAGQSEPTDSVSGKSPELAAMETAPD